MSRTFEDEDREPHLLKGSSETSLATEIGDEIDAFFVRNGFTIESRAACEKFAQDRFPSAIVRPIPSQGYCSYTLTVGSIHIIQFRPGAFNLDLDIISEGKRVLGNLVPCIEPLGIVYRRSSSSGSPGSDQLYGYLLDRITGSTLDELQGTMASDSSKLFKLKQKLVKDLGVAFAKTYIAGASQASDFRRGRVGTSLSWRLQLLQSINSKEVRTVVDQVQEALDAIEALPWCLTHGDLVPANIMIDPSCGRLRGLIDWAEGEYLPFGVGLYGLEEVLGATRNGHFEYDRGHAILRADFWGSFRVHLRQEGFEVNDLEWKNILLARKLGILLWRGIAFAGGRIDRVVSAGLDDSEIHKLHLFLAAETSDAYRVCDRDLRSALQLFYARRTRRMRCLIKGACVRITQLFRALWQAARSSS